MASEAVKEQLRRWLEKSVQEAKNPDPLKMRAKQLKNKRRERKKIIEKKHGF